MPNAGQLPSRPAIGATTEGRGTGWRGTGVNRRTTVGKALRTRAGGFPLAVRLSGTKPPGVEDNATDAYGNAPQTAMEPSEKPRSRTRYDGSQLSRKYHA